jgi:hypothetical protein
VAVRLSGAPLGEILDLADEVHWAVDISGTASALLLALLAAHGRQAVYVPGRTVNRMAGAYRGEAKTDARDAYVIAETARHRQDFATIGVPAQLGMDLAVLTAHRSDLVADRVRMINRLRDVLSGVFPALERAFDYSDHKGALILLTGYQTPGGIRRRGRARLTAWLANRNVRSAEMVAATALEAAQSQCTSLPGEDMASQIVVNLAAQILALDDRIKRIDRQIRETFRTHPQANHRIIAWNRTDTWCRVRWQPAPSQALQPAAAQGVLSVRADQHHPRWPEQGLLPQEARRGLQACPSSYRARSPARKRPLGAPARQPGIRSCPAGPVRRRAG